MRIGLAFTTAEVTMTLSVRHRAGWPAALLGDVAGYLGFAALSASAIYMVVETLRASGEGGLDLSRGGGCSSARSRSASTRSASASRSSTSACRWRLADRDRLYVGALTTWGSPRPGARPRAEETADALGRHHPDRDRHASCRAHATGIVSGLPLPRRIDCRSLADRRACSRSSSGARCRTSRCCC